MKAGTQTAHRLPSPSLGRQHDAGHRFVYLELSLGLTHLFRAILADCIILDPRHTPFSRCMHRSALGIAEGYCLQTISAGASPATLPADILLDPDAPAHSLMDVAGFETPTRRGWPMVSSAILVWDIDTGVKTRCRIQNEIGEIGRARRQVRIVHSYRALRKAVSLAVAGIGSDARVRRESLLRDIAASWWDCYDVLLPFMALDTAAGASPSGTTYFGRYESMAKDVL